jgi:hypothetical protein
MTGLEKTQLTVGVIFSIVGLAAIVVAVVIAAGNAEFKKNALEIPAEITEIDELGYSRNSGTRRVIHIEYEMNGVKYTSELGYNSDSLYEGQILTIFVNMNEPTEIRYGPAMSFNVMLALLFGVPVFSLMGTIVAVILIKRAIKKYVMEHGEMVRAKIVEIKTARAYRDERLQYTVYCRFVDRDGSEHRFKSRPTWNDVSTAVAEKDIRSLSKPVDDVGNGTNKVEPKPEPFPAVAVNAGKNPEYFYLSESVFI